MRTRNTIQAIAALEACKGLLALAAASGLLLLVHRDLHELAVHLVEHLHLNPAAKYPRIFIDAATHLDQPKLVIIALGAVVYSLARLIEAYGLLREAAWAELFAAVSAAIYVPFEAVELVERFSWLSVGALALNIAVVVVMIQALRERRQPSTGATKHSQNKYKG
ncbi:MAG TPA: DUF2127 domain-containing protein [Spongiibacteraceae bacterium]|nr:DUF2127 domain-containing protein [Spongiibacteraceae bacterium]